METPTAAGNRGPIAPRPARAEFEALARPGRLVPVRLDFAFDADTAVTAFAKLRGGPFAFLLESVEGGERWARYSFVGSAPREAWRLDGDEIRVWTPDSGWGEPHATSDPFAEFQAWLGAFEPVGFEELPRFWGGAVGYFGYDTVRWIERLPEPPPSDFQAPDACFMATDRVLILDNLHSKASAVSAVPVRAGDDPGRLYDHAVSRLRAWVESLAAPHGLEPIGLTVRRTVEVQGNRTSEDYRAAVDRVREYIREGDAYQVVVSQRMAAPLDCDPFEVYRVLRITNPSPYLFFMELDGVRLIGSSPETLVRVEEGNVTVRPIAGTRARGRDDTADRAAEVELLSDEKERAEHLMLVDLGRNDVSRVAEAGSVRVPQFMAVERYSHVMHLVSEVTGRLAPGRSAIDALRACFPAGTLTGAPKVRAMEIIDELEPTRRGPYGGAAGYAAYGGAALDVAIVIRTLLATGERLYAQAGAGVVYDSDPEREWEETRDKSRVLLAALERSDPVDPGSTWSAET